MYQQICEGEVLLLLAEPLSFGCISDDCYFSPTFSQLPGRPDYCNAFRPYVALWHAHTQQQQQVKKPQKQLQKHLDHGDQHFSIVPLTRHHGLCLFGSVGGHRRCDHQVAGSNPPCAYFFVRLMVSRQTAVLSESSNPAGQVFFPRV